MQMYKKTLECKAILDFGYPQFAKSIIKKVKA